MFEAKKVHQNIIFGFNQKKTISFYNRNWRINKKIQRYSFSIIKR